MLAQKVGDTRSKANFDDEGRVCPVCLDNFGRGQSIQFSMNNEPVHKYRCWRVYLAAVVVRLELTVVDLVTDLGFEARTAYRIQADARKLGGNYGY